MNGQVLVFNVNLSLHDAINTLAEHNIFCAAIWDEANRKFIDLLTIRDILEVLIFITEQLEEHFPGRVSLLPAEDKKLVNEFLLILYNKIQEKKVHLMEVDGLPPLSSYGSKVEYNFLLSVLKSVKLRDWTQLAGKVIDHKPEILLTKSLKDSLLDACQEMAKNKIHRLAIIESNEKGSNLCGIITHDMIMGYIISNMQGDPRLFEVPIKELDLDTKELVWKSYKHTLLEVLQCLRSKKISFLPIVGDRYPGGTAYPTIGFFSLKDLIKLIRDKKYHMMRASIKDVLNWTQEEGDIDESLLLLSEAMEGTEDDLSTSMKGMSISGELSNDILEEIKHEQLHDKISGIDRLILYKPEDTLKTIVEKLFAAPDKRLVNIRRGTREIIGVISVTNIFVYATS